MKQVKADGQVIDIQSSSIEVGDILLIEEDVMFPADLILVESSTEGG